MRFLIVGAALSVAALVAGCGSINYVRDNYSGVPYAEYSPTGAPGSLFFVYDKPDESRMLLLDRTGQAANAAFLSGATFGAIDASSPSAVFRQVAESWLAGQSRNCTAGTVDKISKAVAEVRYSCQAPATQ